MGVDAVENVFRALLVFVQGGRSLVSGIRVGLDEVVAQFSELEDPRSTINRLHPRSSVVVMAVLAGSSGPTAMAHWALLKKDLLLKHLALPHGIPGKDVFRRVLMANQENLCAGVIEHNQQ